MENLKMYVEKEKLNDYEREHNKISFKTLVNKLFSDMILCNDITKLFYTDINGVYTEPQVEIGEDYDQETEEYVDIYQYFIVDFSNWTYEFMKKYKEELGKEFILYYIDELDLYILRVTNLGTGWDYVLTDIEPSESTENTQF